MIRRNHRASALVAALVLPAGLLLAGCSSSAIDVPDRAPAAAVDSTAPTAVPTAVPTTPAAEPTAGATVEVLDCAAVLPVTAIEAALELPEGFVTASDQGSGCAWAMAGNPAALVLQTATGATTADVAAQQSEAPVEPSGLGDAAFFRAGDPAVDPAATVVVLAGDRLLSLRSYVGGQAPLEELATEVLAALGQDDS
ncbi:MULTISPECIES: hypothetical protein [unclassified Rathayibacter]|uniref:hypothetical protein n=1 Tax=unclassified Rathayibacter TaxID=2609250 RepID=UPI001043200B|nr:MULTISPECIES: hypothetical protein [unclassified Rathayibacter]TCL84893.1 hypothetical protein EDF49_102567 [Rathayibacter sp. PhB192]TCM30611.1 hypothetical protein EDF43_102567 [Rathayibacter sp. PhB179]